MDTHITATPEFDRIGVPLGSPIGLPGKLGKQADILDEAPAPSPAQVASAEQPVPPKKSRRKALLATAALSAILLAGTGGAAWWYRLDLRALDLRYLALPAFLHGGTGPRDQPPAEVGLKPEAAAQARRPDAPAALRPQVSEFAALQSLPNNAPAEVGVSAPATILAASPREPAPGPSPATEAQPTQAAVPVPEPAPLAGPQVVSVATDMTRVPSAAAKTPAGPSPAPPAAAPVAASPLTQRPVTASAGASAPAAITTPVPAPAPAASPAHPPAVTSVPASRDPVAVVAELRAAPLSPPEQVKVVDLLKELGAQLRDTRAEVVQLRTTVAQLVETVDTKTTQFESRLGLAEAGTVLAQSARAGHPETASPAPPLPPVSRVAATGRMTPPSQQGGTPPASSAARTVRDYRIQGASPGLAVLSVLNPLPGGKPVIEVSTGGEVPGVGRIKSIAQRGTAWVVQTDAGVIQ